MLYSTATRNYKVLLQFYSSLQSTIPTLLQSSLYYNVLITPVLLRTTRYYSNTIHITTYYSNTTYYGVLVQYYSVLLQYYSVLQRITPVQQNTTKYYKKILLLQ